MKLTFTATGLVKKGKGYCRNWDDIFSVEGKTTSRQKSIFKNKYEDSIKQVTYTTTNVHGEKRTNVYMVATQELAGNKKVSDYQKLAFVDSETEVKTNAERFANKITTSMKLALKGLDESLVYNFNCTLIDGDVVDLETGEIVYNQDRLFRLVSDIAKNADDADEIILSVVATLYIDLGKKVIVVKEDENGDRVVISRNLTTVKEELISGKIKVTNIEREDNTTVITIKENEKEVIYMKRYEIDGVKYCLGGIKTESRYNVSLWSSDYLDVFADKETYDPFEREEERKKKEAQEMMKEAIMAILPIVVGEENYIKYRLHQVERIASPTLAEYFNTTDSSIRKISERTRKKIEDLVKNIENNRNLESTISQIAFELRDKANGTRAKSKIDSTDYDFDFEEMEKEYHNNIKQVERQLGLKNK